MVGNVNGIVESMFAADNVRNQQSTASQNAGKFSDYLDSALLNYRSGLLTGTLGSNYSYMNALTGQSSWQTAILELLRNELKKNRQTDEKNEAGQKEAKETNLTGEKKPAWATIRVIERYRSPVLKPEEESQGIIA